MTACVVVFEVVSRILVIDHVLSIVASTCSCFFTIIWHLYVGEDAWRYAWLHNMGNIKLGGTDYSRTLCIGDISTL